MSHAETLTMFQCALARTDIPVQYSEGFNPHLRLSLPLPRSVGIEVDEDVLCVKIKADSVSFDADDFKAKLSAQLPDGCEILNASVAWTGASAIPIGATYLFEIKQDYFDESLTGRIADILKRSSISLNRQIDQRGSIRNVDVRPYIDTITAQDGRIAVQCNISPAGSIRVDEILELLEMDIAKLAAPVRRINIKWETN